MLHGPLLRRTFRNPTLPGLLVVSLLILAGCSVGEFLGAYFNTYYNASRAFSEAEQELLNGQDPKQAEKGYLPPYVVPAGAKTKFTAVIEKCSKLLQYHPESDFVDDALLMIGKSYYYQNENQSAERKFRELIDGQPASDLVPEAKVLLANTLYRAGNTDGAAAAARDMLNAPEDTYRPGIRSRAAMLLAAIAVDAKNYESALTHYTTVAATAENDQDRFTARIRMAEMEVQLKEYQRAGETYALAEDDATDYLSDYRARVGRAKMLALVGEYDASLSQLRDLLANTNNRDMFGEIDFEIGNTLRLSGETERAVDQYRYVDTAYARTEFSARALYEAGLLYEKQLFRYDSARAAYGKGRAVAGQAAVAPLLALRSDALNRYFTLSQEIAKNESLRIAILFPPDSLLADTLAPHADSLHADSLLPSTPHVDTTRSAGVHSSMVQGDTLGPAMDSLHAEQGGRDTSALPDSLKKGTTHRDSLPLAADTTAGADSLSRRPRWVPVAIPLDTVRTRLALAQSELGALFFNVLEVNDSAAYWFRRLLDENPGSVHVPRALYTLAQVARQDSQPALADSLYRVLADRYGATEFGGAARKFLGYAATSDSSDGTEDLYRSAELELEAGKPTEALARFKSLVREHPASKVAAKAQYASGWIYEQILAQPESAEVYYRALSEHFAGTPFALAAKPKLDAADQYRREKAAQEQARKDSLARAAERPRTDSTAAGHGAEPSPAMPDSTGIVVPDTSGVPPPETVPEEHPGDVRDVPPPEIVPDTTGAGQAEPPGENPDQPEEPQPPPPDSPGPGGQDCSLR